MTSLYHNDKIKTKHIEPLAPVSKIRNAPKFTGMARELIKEHGVTDAKKLAKALNDLLGL